MQVLLVDDSPLVRDRLVSLLLEVAGVDRVLVAKNVTEGVRQVSSAGAGLVVVDMRLPDGDGLQVLQAAKALHPAPEVVIFTSFSDDETRAACLNAGADEFLDKGKGLDRLLAMVTRRAGQAT
jgi:DNA-binding NarL/FixJ family response regulator